MEFTNLKKKKDYVVMVMFMWKSVWYFKKINAVKSLAVKVTEIIFFFLSDIMWRRLSENRKIFPTILTIPNTHFLTGAHHRYFFKFGTACSKGFHWSWFLQVHLQQAYGSICVYQSSMLNLSEVKWPLGLIPSSQEAWRHFVLLNLLLCELGNPE